jgi:hypothetical protein
MKQDCVLSMTRALEVSINTHLSLPALDGIIVIIAPMKGTKTTDRRFCTFPEMAVTEISTAIRDGNQDPNSINVLVVSICNYLAIGSTLDMMVLTRLALGNVVSRGLLMVYDGLAITRQFNATFQQKT